MFSVMLFMSCLLCSNSLSTNSPAATASTTRRLLSKPAKSVGPLTQGGGAGAGDGLSMLEAAEKRWDMTKSSPPTPPPSPFIRPSQEMSPPSLDSYDVAILGSTLGLIYATKLQSMGASVAVVERAKVQGRSQEWNIGTGEFHSLQSALNLDLTPAIGSCFDTNRVGFGEFECRVKGVLDLGIKPDIMTGILKEEFEKAGGICFEDTSVSSLLEHPDSVVINKADEEPLCKAKIILDCTGNGSPIARDYRKDKPSGICVVVGTCASGYSEETNDFGDVIYTNGGINEKNLQYFWESFPVGMVKEGEKSNTKTTYMFTYLDADSRRPTIESIFDDYFDLLPSYQPSLKSVEDLNIIRSLSAFFPTYKASPLKKTPTESSSSAMRQASSPPCRRITSAVHEAIPLDLSSNELQSVNSYLPNLSAAWMFQKAMMKTPDQGTDSGFIERLLSGNFKVMDDMGPRTMVPFLQDVVRFDGLLGSLAGSFIATPLEMPIIIGHVGIPALIEWMGHVAALAAFTMADALVSPNIDPDRIPNQKERW
eukprot:CAMPEP_0118671584 /NCGR_PEP_ID=MMETSP0785-20121206/22080_1 /TAXON_ID=91992 /ORGANISM="Bolidomonas pacifica, Strain CCMP 1866" /LENGTH=537 /DNA_ID=CAMNT_0006566479 /DNA_START=77 /DNA_END=1688 /DNA_ORIENTATION=-